jgi:hypothetical protein
MWLGKLAVPSRTPRACGRGSLAVLLSTAINNGVSLQRRGRWHLLLLRCVEKARGGPTPANPALFYLYPSELWYLWRRTCVFLEVDNSDLVRTNSRSRQGLTSPCAALYVGETFLHSPRSSSDPGYFWRAAPRYSYWFPFSFSLALALMFSHFITWWQKWDKYGMHGTVTNERTMLRRLSFYIHVLHSLKITLA